MLGEAEGKPLAQGSNGEGETAGAELDFPTPVPGQGGRRAGEQQWEGWDRERKKKLQKKKRRKKCKTPTLKGRCVSVKPPLLWQEFRGLISI